MTLDIIESMLSTLTLIAPVSQDVLRQTDKCITIRTFENKPRQIVYMDGTNEGSYKVLVICVSNDMDECVDQLKIIGDALTINNQSVSSNIDATSFVESGPEFKGLRTKGPDTFVYEMLVSMTYVERSN